jgi:hypothetical protein
MLGKERLQNEETMLEKWRKMTAKTEKKIAENVSLEMRKMAAKSWSKNVYKKRKKISKMEGKN